MRKMKNISFFLGGEFITALIISATICLLSLAGGVTYAVETQEDSPIGTSINANCATVNDQITIDIPCAEFSTTRFSVTLDIYTNPVDTEGLYFRLSDLPKVSDNDSSCASIDDNLNLNINCVAFDGSQYTLFLENYRNLTDSEWFYWKVVDSDNKSLGNMDESSSTNKESSTLRASNFSFNQNQTDISSSEDLANKPAVRAGGTRASQPNLTPYTPSGWSDKIVVSTITGITTNSTTLSPTDTLYVDWAIINNGTLSASTKFYTKLYVDGLEKTSWYTDSLLTTYYVYVKDYSIGKLSAGTHTIKIKTDSAGVISESNESDNEYTKTITIKNGGSITISDLIGIWSNDKVSFEVLKDGSIINFTAKLPTDGLCYGDGSIVFITFNNVKINSNSSNGFSFTASVNNTADFGYQVEASMNGTFVSTKQVNVTWSAQKGNFGCFNYGGYNKGNGTFSITKTSSIPSVPSAPTWVSATDGTYTDKIQLTWNSSSGADSYEVWRNTSNSTSSSSKITTITTTSYNDSTLTAGTTYYYWVKAKNSTGTSGFSNSDSGYKKVVVPVPSAPTGVSATDGQYLWVKITWNSSSRASSYEVWRNTSNITSSASKITTTTSTSYFDWIDDNNETTYYYWIKAVNSTGTSGFSNSDSGYMKSIWSW